MEDLVTPGQGTPTEPAPPVPGGLSDQETPVETDQQMTAPAQPAPVDWDSPSNPYKYAAEQLGQQARQAEYQRSEQAIMAEAQAAIQRGVPPAIVEQALNNWRTQQQLAQQQQQLEVQSRPAVARIMAEQLSNTYNVKITAGELLKTSNGVEITSPQAMLARADALVHERRSKNFNERKQAGADKVETGNGNVGLPNEGSLKKMSPTQILAMGLARQSQ